jgi:hypothetical protein
MVALGLALLALTGCGCVAVESLGSGRTATGDRNSTLAHEGVCPETVSVVNHTIWGPFGFYTHPNMLTFDVAWFTR